MREEKLPENHLDLALIHLNMSKLYLVTQQHDVPMKYVKQN